MYIRSENSRTYTSTKLLARKEKISTQWTKKLPLILFCRVGNEWKQGKKRRIAAQNNGKSLVKFIPEVKTLKLTRQPSSQQGKKKISTQWTKKLPLILFCRVGNEWKQGKKRRIAAQNNGKSLVKFIPEVKTLKLTRQPSSQQGKKKISTQWTKKLPLILFCRVGNEWKQGKKRRIAAQNNGKSLVKQQGS